MHIYTIKTVTEISPSGCLFGAHQSAYPIPIQQGSQLVYCSVLWLGIAYKLQNMPEKKINGCDLKVYFFLLEKLICGTCGLFFSICAYFECSNWKPFNSKQVPNYYWAKLPKSPPFFENWHNHRKMTSRQFVLLGNSF